MFELKLAAAAAALYRSVLGLSIKLVHRRDRANYRRYHARVNRAERMETMARALWDEAATETALANEAINAQARGVNAALNDLENARDDISLRV